MLILTDMLRGMLANICIPYLEKGKVELITGINLPMVISSITNHKGKTLSELSECVRNSGKESFCTVYEQARRTL